MLDGADIHSETSAAIYVRQADKVFLTMATGSVNTLSNGGTFTAIDENNIERFLSLLKEMIYALLAVSFYDSNFIIKAQPFYVG